jgi:hypothetical protein
MVKKPHLVCYDYGMGGVWAIMRAHSKDEILLKYPELTIADTQPIG